MVERPRMSEGHIGGMPKVSDVPAGRALFLCAPFCPDASTRSSTARTRCIGMPMDQSRVTARSRPVTRPPELTRVEEHVLLDPIRHL